MIALSDHFVLEREESPDSTKHGTLCKQGRGTASFRHRRTSLWLESNRNESPALRENETGNPYRLQLIVVIKIAACENYKIQGIRQMIILNPPTRKATKGEQNLAYSFPKKG